MKIYYSEDIDRVVIGEKRTFAPNSIEAINFQDKIALRDKEISKLHLSRINHNDIENIDGDLIGGDIDNVLTYVNSQLERVPYSEISIKSSLEGEPIGSSVIPNIVSISQSDYDNANNSGLLVSTTYYVILE